MKVCWGLGELPGLLAELDIDAPFLLATRRWDPPVPVVGRWSELPTDRLAEIDTAGADGLLALGGGSTIDSAKALSARADLPLVSVPTTYSGAEWTSYFGVRDADRRFRGGGGGALLAGIVYEVELTLELPREVTGGTALNALAHACEALYVRSRDPDADELALRAARAIASVLPAVLDDLRARQPRARLLAGAALAGEALARSGLALGHAMAQAIGGRYGLPHGALNAICLPAALRFNDEFVPQELADALGGDPATRCEELARLAGFSTLGARGVREEDLYDLSEAIVARPGARANPRPVTAAQVEELLRSIY
jgi:maleylacetate reductase